LQAGNWFDLRDNYGLLYFYEQGEAALEKAHELLAMPDLKEEWAARRAKLLADKIDPTPWFVALGNRLLENPHYRPE
jgi:predicted glycosyltransferase